MAVHQLIHRVAIDDGSSQRAVSRRTLLRRLGHDAPLFAVETPAELEALAWPHSELKPVGGDVVLYVHDRASELSARTMHLDAPRAVIFEGWDEEPVLYAQAQLAGMARLIPGAIAPLKSLASEL